MKAVIFDLETTGLVEYPLLPCQEQPRIVQIGAITVVNGAVVENLCMNCIVDPEVTIPEKVVKIHGITSFEASKHKPFSESIGKLKEVFHGSDCIVGQNVVFDIKVLHNNLLLCGEHNRFPFAPVVIDIFTEAKRKLGSSGTLVEIYQKVFNKPFANAHSAYDDCLAVYDICREWDLL